MIAAFSSRSPIGTIARWTRARTSAGSVLPVGADAVEDLRAFWIVGDGFDGGPRVHEVRVGVAARCAGESVDHPDGILEPVPARDLEDERLLGPSGGSRVEQRPGCHLADGAVDAREPRRAPANLRATSAAARIDEIVAASSSWFFGANGSIDGLMNARVRGGMPSQTYEGARRRRRRRRSTYGSRNSQAERASSPGASTPMWQRQMTGMPAP